MLLNNVLLNDEQFGGCLSDRVGIENAAMFYQLAHVFTSKNLSRETFTYIERCFSMVAETTNFLELDHMLLIRVLSNCRLNVTSELEVFNAVENWLNYKQKERKKFTNNIFGACFSEQTLRLVLDTATSKDSLNAANDVITTRKKTNMRLANRFCSQTSFDVLFCGGLNRGCGRLHDIIAVDGADLKSSKKILKFDGHSISCYKAAVVRVKGSLYAVGGLTDRRDTIQVVKYSLAAKEQELAASTPFKRRGFCVCALLSDVYVIGGGERAASDECLAFDTERSQFRKAATMRRKRENAACALFRGKIVVCGGHDATNQRLRCVESFNGGSEWTFMPSMIRERCYHSVAATSSKLFVVGGFEPSCEVYDASGGRFVEVKIPTTKLKLDEESFENKCESVVVGSKFYAVFYHPMTKVVCYDYGTGSWSEVQGCEAIRNGFNFCCVAVPKF